MESVLHESNLFMSQCIDNSYAARVGVSYRHPAINPWPVNLEYDLACRITLYSLGTNEQTNCGFTKHL